MMKKRFKGLPLGGLVVCMLLTTGANAEKLAYRIGCSDNNLGTQCRLTCITPTYEEQDFPAQFSTSWQNLVSHIDQGLTITHNCAEGPDIRSYACNWTRWTGGLWHAVPTYSARGADSHYCEPANIVTSDSTQLQWLVKAPFYELQNVPNWASKIVAVRKQSDTRLKIFGRNPSTGAATIAHIPELVVLGGVSVTTGQREVVDANTGLIQLHVTPAMLDSLGVPQ